jgi:hypothetical protein
LITSKGKILAHVTTPANPPQHNTLTASRAWLSSAEMIARLLNSYDQK